MRTVTPSHRLVGLLAFACAITAAGCSPTPDTRQPAVPVSTEPVPEADEAVTEPVEARPTEDAPAAEADGLVPASWAHAAVNVGDELATVQLGPVSVRLNDSGRLPATQDQFFSDGTQAMAEGEPVVYLSWTVTNTSDAPVPMSASMISVTPSFQNRTLGYEPRAAAGYEALGLPQRVIQDHNEAGIYPLAPGESFTEARTVPLNDIDVLDVVLRLTPKDESGLLFDLEEKAEVSVDLA